MVVLEDAEAINAARAHDPIRIGRIADVVISREQSVVHDSADSRRVGPGRVAADAVLIVEETGGVDRRFVVSVREEVAVERAAAGKERIREAIKIAAGRPKRKVVGQGTGVADDRPTEVRG